MNAITRAPKRATSTARPPIPAAAKALPRKFPDISDEGTIGADAQQLLSTAEIEVHQALEADDLLGFDYPHQALDAVLREPHNFDVSQRTLDALAQLESGAGAPQHVPPVASEDAKPLAALYETIFITLPQVLCLDEEEDAAKSQRLTRMTADRFSQFRRDESSMAGAQALENLYNIEALVHGAHDVEDATAARSALLQTAIKALNETTAHLVSSGDWHAEDPKPATAAAAPRTPGEQRAGWVFGSISSLASTVSQLCVDFVHEATFADEAAETKAVAALALALALALADQIALLASIGQQDVGHGSISGVPDARACLLPPVYHTVRTTGEQQ